MSIVPSQKFRFLGGEVSPILYDSADMEQYGRWFSKAENIRFDTLGAFKNRTGFEKVYTSPTALSGSKLLEFSYENDDSYLILMTPTNFFFFRDGVPIYKDGDETKGVYTITHNMSLTQSDIKYVQIGDIIYLVNGTENIGKLTRNNASGYNWTFSAFNYYSNCAPLGEANVDVSKKISITNAGGGLYVANSNFSYFDKKHVGDVFAVVLQVEREETTLRQNGTDNDLAVGTTSTPIRTNGMFSLVTTGNWKGESSTVGGEFVVEYMVSGGAWKECYKVTSYEKDQPNNQNIAIDITGALKGYDFGYVRMRVTKKIKSETVAFSAFMMNQRFAVKAYFRIDTIISATFANCTSLRSGYVVPSGDIIESFNWQNQVFNSSFGYPDIIGFYQNRLFIGHDYLLYSSKINEYNNFLTPATLTADDPITMSLLSTKYNKIRNILTMRKFFVFTDSAEFGIQSQTALTQTDKTLLPLSYHGSNKCLPIVAGNLVLFVDGSNRVVRIFKYSYETDSFEANDSTVLISKLLEGKNIITTEYLKNEKEALFLDDKGTVWVFKLMPEQDIYCWSHWKYAGSGKITNICAVPNSSEEDLYIIVYDANRRNGQWRIERMTKDKFYDYEETVTVGTARTSFSTPFVEGTRLLIEANGDKLLATAGANGAISVPTATAEITCHYVYNATATLLAPVTNLTENALTTYNKGKPFKVHFAYQDSYGFKVGVEEGDKMSVKFHKGDLPEADTETTGKRSVLIPAKYDGSSKVSFVQDNPYNMTINNIMIDMDYGGK